MFHKEEVEEKRRRIRNLLPELGLDAIYLKRSANFAWITGGGYNIVGMATEIGVAGILVTASRAYLVCNNIESPRMEKEELLAEQGLEIETFPWYDDREVALVESLGGKAVGFDHALPGARDVSGAVTSLRYSLTPWEVERYREQGRLTALTVEECAREVRPGDTEYSVIGKVAERLWSRGMDFIVAFCAADERISLFRHPVATEKRIRQKAMISVNSRRLGLIVSLTRFIHFGKVPEELRRLYESTVYVDTAMMAATRPGRPAVEAFLAGLDAYREVGYPEEYMLHHQGGAIGYQGRDYKVTSQTTEVVRENQGFAWNPSITGAKSEDTMLATGAGPLILSEPVIYPSVLRAKGGCTFRRPAILEM